MTSRNGKAMVTAIVAGMFLLIAGVNGVVAWETIKSFVTTYIIDNNIIQIIFVVLIFIASLGGIAVIAGGLLIGKDKVGIGKFVIALGAGMGIIGLIFSSYVSYKQGSLTIGSFTSVGAIGIILSIIARYTAEGD
jgi:hypothetical protein